MNGERVTRLHDAIRTHRSARTRIHHAHLLHHGARGLLHVGHRHAVVARSGAALLVEVVHHRGLAVEEVVAMATVVIGIGIDAVKAVDWAEGVVVVAQPPLKAHAHAGAAMTKATVRTIVRIRRQRRPADMVPTVTPTHPGRSPIRPRHPHPAITVVVHPAAVVKRHPTPGIIGQPIPTVIRVDPAPGRVIGTPAAIADGNRRPPAKSVSRHVHPSAVWIQHLGVLHGLRGRGDHRRLLNDHRLLHDHGGGLRDDDGIGGGNVGRDGVGIDHRGCRQRSGLVHANGAVRRMPQHRDNHDLRHTRITNGNHLFGIRGEWPGSILHIGEQDRLGHA